MSHSTKALRIDVTADVACPWCLIGTRRLDRALAQLNGVTIDVVYHPFLVQPEALVDAAPRELEGSRQGRAQSKYGNPEPLLRRVEAVALANGISLDLTRVGPATVTIGAHTLLRHAAERGSQRAFVRALFGAHFLESRDIGSEPVLEALACSHGFAAGEASALLRDPREAALTQERAQAGLDQGITIAPHVVLDQRVLIAGARSLEVFRSALEGSLVRSALEGSLVRSALEGSLAGSALERSLVLP